MDDFGVLKRYIEQTLKIQCGNYKEDYIKRRILSRMRSTNTANYDEYLKYLKGNPPELEVLRKALTINVTEFFRDNDVYEILKKEVLPHLFSKRKRIRIWCAGCSTGEEPYSIAMILHDFMLQNKELTGQIYATDIDKIVLAKAQEGIYPPKAMVKLSESQIHRHFTKLAGRELPGQTALKRSHPFPATRSDGGHTNITVARSYYLPQCHDLLYGKTERRPCTTFPRSTGQ